MDHDGCIFLLIGEFLIFNGMLALSKHKYSFPFSVGNFQYITCQHIDTPEGFMGIHIPAN